MVEAVSGPSLAIQDLESLAGERARDLPVGRPPSAFLLETEGALAVAADIGMSSTGHRAIIGPPRSGGGPGDPPELCRVVVVGDQAIRCVVDEESSAGLEQTEDVSNDLFAQSRTAPGNVFDDSIHEDEVEVSHLLFDLIERGCAEGVLDPILESVFSQSQPIDLDAPWIDVEDADPSGSLAESTVVAPVPHPKSSIRWSSRGPQRYSISGTS